MEKEKLRVILTGSAGRIARAVRSAFSAAWDLQCYSRSAGDGVKPLQDLLTMQAPMNAGVLLHTAWSCVPATAESMLEVSPDLALLRALLLRLQNDPSPPFLVFFSTGAVYGPAPGRPSLETDAPHPKGRYSQGKLQAEELCLASGLPVCILRVGNVYGLHSQPSDAQGVLGHMIRAGISGNVFRQWGGHSVKDYLHRDDFLSALGAVALTQPEGIWNLGSGAGTSLDTLLALVEQVLGRRIAVQAGEAPEWDVQDNRIDISKFRQALGWTPRISLDQGVRSEIHRLLATA